MVSTELSPREEMTHDRRSTLALGGVEQHEAPYRLQTASASQGKGWMTRYPFPPSSASYNGKRC